MSATHRIEYRAPVSPRVPIVLFTFALLLGLLLLILSLVQGGPWAFVVLWILVTGSVAVGLLFVTCFEMVVEDGLLHWRTGFQHGTMPMDQAERVASQWAASCTFFSFEEPQKFASV